MNTVGTEPSRAGYAFAGWNTAVNGSGTHYDADGSITITEDTTLYAEWTRTAALTAGSHATASPASVVFYYDADGKAYYNKSTTAQTAAVPVTLTPATGWKAVGWTSSASSTTADALTSGGVAPSNLAAATQEFYALTSRGVKVSYDVNNADAGTAPGEQAGTQIHNASGSATTKPEVSLAAKPADLVKKGHSFAGWEIGGTTCQPGGKFSWDDDTATAEVTAVPKWTALTVNAPTGKTLPYTGSAQKLADAGSVDDSTMKMVYSTTQNGTYSDSVPEASAVDTYTVWYKVVDANGNTVTDPASVSAVISAVAPAYTAPRANALTYDGADQVLASAGSATGGTMKYSLTGADNTWTDDITTLTGRNAGAYTVYYKVEGDSNHSDIAAQSVSVTIDKLEAVLSWSSTSFTYDKAQHVPTATVSNLRSQNGVQDTCTVTVTGGQTDANTGGSSYTATATALSNTNYKLPTNVTQAFTIAPLTVGLTWGSTALTYNGKDQAPTVTATGLVSGDSCNVTVSGEQKHPGLSYTATAASLDNPNYKLPLIATTNFSIAKAPLTVTAKPKTITYGDAPANDGVTYSGFVNGETDSVLSGTLSYTYDYAQYGNVGNGYKIAPGGLTSADYDITFAEGALTVEQREVTLVWSSPAAFDYTGSPITWPLPAVGNTVNGDALTAKWATPAGPKDVATAADADTYTPKVDGLLGAKASNYKLPAAPATTGTWSINPPGTNAMSVTIAGWTYGKYGATANAPTVIADFGANTATFEYFTDAACTTWVDASNPRTPPTNAGGYYVKATIAATTNYRGATAVAPFTVSKANITVTADDKGSKRGEPKKALTYSVSGDLVAADRAGLDAYVTLSESVNTQITGIYPITVSAAAHPNYDIAKVDGTYTVTRALANVTAAGYAGTYDGKDVDSVTGNPKAIEVTVSDPETSTAFDGSSAPTVTVYYGDKDFQTELGLSDAQVSALRGDNISDLGFVSAWNYLQGKLQAGNYAMTSPKYADAGTHKVYFMVVSDQVSPDVIFGSKDVVINKAPLTVTAKDKAVTYGDDPANDGVTYSGFVNGENENTAARTGALSYAYGGYAAGSPAGKYAITPAGLSFSNYDVVYKPGTLTVGRRAVTVTAEPVEVTYGDAPAGNGVKCDGLQGSDTAASLGTPSYSFTYSQYGNVGAYQVMPAGLSSPNYAITYAPGALTVKPRPLTLTWPASDSFAYTGSELTYGAPALGGIVNGDDVTVGDYEGDKATTAGTHTAEVTSLAGAKSGNYALPANKSHDWTIVGAANRATVALEGWTYGDGPNEPAVEAAFGKDTAEFSYAASENGPFEAAVPTAAGTYWVKATIAASGNHDGAEATAKFTIAKRPATVTAKPQVVEAGGAIATGLDQVALTGAASGDALSAVVLAGSSTAAVTESGTVTPSGAVLKNASGADVTANYDITYKPGALLVAGVKAAENGKLIYAMAKDVWLTVDEAAKLLAASDAEAQMAKLADVRAQDTATGAALDVQVADRGGLAAVAGEYKVTFKVNPEVQVMFHVTGTAPDSGPSATKPDSSRKAASPATGDTVPVALLAATALASVCVLAFSWRRRESALPGKHARK